MQNFKNKKSYFTSFLLLFFICGQLTVGPFLFAKEKVVNDYYLKQTLINNKISKASTTLKYVPGEIIIKYKKDKINLNNKTGLSKADNMAKASDIIPKELIKLNNLQIAKTKGNETVEAAVDRLKKNSDIEYAEPNYIVPLTSTPNDTSFNLLWGQHNTGQSVNGASGTLDADIDAPEAWDIFKGTSTVIVAVIDTGIAYNHPDLVNRMWDGSSSCFDENNNATTTCLHHGWNYYESNNDPLDNYGHGTHVAGTIGAQGNNGLGVVGINWNTKIMALKAGSGYGLTTSAIIKSIDFAINNGAKIINASYGGAGFSQAEYDAVERFRSAGGIFIASAGNSGYDNETTHSYPSDFDLDNIISVAASDQNDQLATFSNFGTSSVDVAAPGVNIYSDEGHREFDENFESATTSEIGLNFTQSGSSTWGVLSNASGTNKIIISDYANWGSYASNTNSNLDSISIDLSSKTNSYIYFEYYCYTDISDYIELLYYNGSDWISSGDYFYGYDSGVYTGSLKNYANANFKIRFQWATDANYNDYGCAIDNIKIVDPESSSGGYQYMDGTSMAAPQVTGLASLIWSYNPYLNYSQVRNIILDTGDDISNLSTIATGKRVNANNALNIFRPHIGFTENDIIPSNQINQATDGSGQITINFRLKDGYAGIIATTSLFAFSLDNGNTWQTPISGDNSSALSTDWTANNYLTNTDYSSTTFSITFNTKDDEVVDLNSTSTANMKIRFAINDGATTSPLVISESFNLDNYVAPATITTPISTTTIDEDTYNVSGTAEVDSIVYIYANDVLATTSSLAGTTTFLKTMNLEQNATTTFKVVVRDAYGNYSSTSTAPAIKDYNTIPTSIIGVGNDLTSPYHTSSTSPLINISGEEGMSCRWSSSDLSYSDMVNNCAISSSTAICALPDQGVDGLKMVYVSCADAENIEQTAAKNLDIAFILDTIAPTASLNNTPANSTTNNSISITVNGDGVVYYKYKIDDNAYSSSYATTSLISLNGLSVGAHTLKVIGGDEAENWQSTSSSTNFSWTISQSYSGGGGGGGSSYTTPSTGTKTTSTTTSSTTATSTSETTKKIDNKTEDKNNSPQKTTELNHTASSNNTKTTTKAITLWQNIKEEAKIIVSSGTDLDSILNFTNTKKNRNAQIFCMNNFTNKLTTGSKLSTQKIYAINNFIVYGTPNTAKLGIVTRKELIESFKIAFKKLPTTNEDYLDILAMAVGRWPANSNKDIEKIAQKNFQKIYKRTPNIKNNTDTNAIKIMAYGLRFDPAKEKSKINTGQKTFKNIFKRQVKNLSDWNIVRAILFSGAKR